MDIAFVRIPKTASRSIKSTGLFICTGHEPIHLMKEKYNFDYSFAVVRNPYDRLVSAFFQGVKYLKENKFPNFEEYNLYNNIEEFILDSENSFLYGSVKTGKTFPYPENMIHPHYNSQSHYIVFENKIFVNKLLRFENLNQDWEELLNELNINFVPLPLINQSHHRDWKKYYNEELANIVYNHYKEDFLYLNYDRNSWRK